MISPDERNLSELIERLGCKSLNCRSSAEQLNELYEDEAVKKAVVNELARFGEANGLRAFEMPAQVKLAKEKWTPQNELVTETQKIRRQKVYQFYKQSIEAMYAAVQN